MPPLVREQQQTSSLLMDPNAERFKDCTGKVKCVLVGDGAVGKTSLVVSYTTNGYPTEYVPTAFDNYNVIVTVDNQPIRLQLCDTAGQDDFDSLRPLCYPGADVFLLCFSVVSPTSFHNVRDKWLPEIRNHCPHVPIVLVGTQCDLRSDVKILIELASYREQPVPETIANRLASLIGAVSYIESSALTQKNLKEVFDTAILVSLQKNDHPIPPPPFYHHHHPHQSVSNNHNNNKSRTTTGQTMTSWGQFQPPPPPVHFYQSNGRCPLHDTTTMMMSSCNHSDDNDRKTNKSKRGGGGGKWRKLCCFS